MSDRQRGKQYARDTFNSYANDPEFGPEKAPFATICCITTRAKLFSESCAWMSAAMQELDFIMAPR